MGDPKPSKPVLARARATLCAAALAAAGLHGGAARAADAGALIFGVHHEAVRFELDRQRARKASLSALSTEMLGYGGGVATDVEVDKRVTAAPDLYTVKLLRSTGDGFSRAAALKPFAVSTGHVSGPVLPSPTARLFAMHTIERAGLGEPPVDHVYVFDERSKVQMRVAGLRDPVWLGNDRLVAVSGNGLYVVTVPQGKAQRVGRPGLAQPGTAPRRPAVSPDGRWVAFAQGDAIWRIGVDGENLARVTRPRPGQSWPAWSPDGARLAVVRRACPPVGGASPPPELVIVSATATDQDIERLPTVKQADGLPVRTCGPIYWVR